MPAASPWPPNHPKSFWAPWPASSRPTASRVTSPPGAYAPGVPRPLVAVALRQEAAHIAGVDADVVLTGPGKVSAAVAVAAAIQRLRPTRVLNVGTAGALRDGLAGVHVVGRVLEHDFDREGLEALLGEPLPGGVVLDPTSPIVLATGDRFVQDDVTRAALGLHAHLVDMEGYAVARACDTFGVPCELVKVVSDEASEGALASWQASIDHSARLIAAAVAERLA